ncbi:response regulator [Leptospira sp. 'Mane']|uniref:response regulator n=1 Tax=Leptospira sp. 'Mane' TaxID=3387407 RepID=UPI00398A689F
MHKLLLVDDDEFSAEIVQHSLRKYDLSITYVNNGVIASKIVQKESFDLIISDVMMPEMDGFTFLEGSMKHIGETPVIILTALDKVNCLDQLNRVTVSSYMVKPITKLNLMTRIAKALSLQELNLLPT